MNKRGKVIRVSKDGAALVMVEGRQHWVNLAEVCRPGGSAQPGLDVEVELDRVGRIVAMIQACEIQRAGWRRERSAKEPDTRLVAILQRIAGRCGAGKWLHRRTG